MRRLLELAQVTELPVADGGDGTLAAAVLAGYRRISLRADGPCGQPVVSALAICDGVAVVELADVVGLRRLPAGPEPMRASTYGLGQLVSSALDQDARTIIIGTGGSASTDGGAGMLQALGAVLTDRHGEPLARGGAALAELEGVDMGGLDPRLRAVEVVVASDVDNPLLGGSGAAAVFGPQKGASPEQVAELERGLAIWAERTTEATGLDLAGVPGAGSAGGTGFAALSYLGGRIRPGIDLVLELVGMDRALARADLVVTGEGSLDRQSLRGKAPVGVARAAGRRGVPVIAVAGRVGLPPDELAAAGIAAACSLESVEPDAARSMRDAGPLLFRIGQRIAADLPRFLAVTGGP